MPIEEVLFFLVIPLCALADLQRGQRHPRTVHEPPATMTGLGYTVPAVLVGADRLRAAS